MIVKITGVRINLPLRLLCAIVLFLCSVGINESQEVFVVTLLLSVKNSEVPMFKSHSSKYSFLVVLLETKDIFMMSNFDLSM